MSERRTTVAMIELRHLHYVTGLAKTMNFTVAAKQMHVAQPALSQNIQHIEEELGIKLFERNTHGVRLTQAGSVFCHEALRTLEQLERTKQLSICTARGKSGELTIGVTTDTILGSLPKMISKYRKMYPNVQLNLKELPLDEMVSSLKTGGLDLICTEGLVFDDSLDSVDLPALPVVAAISCANPLGRESTPIKLSSLADETFIFPTPYRMHSVYFTFVAACRNAGFEPKQGYYADSAVAGIGYVAANLGVDLIPRLPMIRPSPSIVWRTIVKPSLAFRMQLLSRKGDVPIPAQSFLSLAS